MNRGVLRRVALIVGAVVVGLAVATAIPIVFEEHFLFHPDRELVEKPEEWGLDHEEVWLEAGSVRVHSWHVKGKHRALVLFFHGNAGNIGGRLRQASAMVALGLDVLLVEYPGYGKSGGEPTEASIVAAADAAHAWAEKAKPKRLLSFGESLGGAVAIDLAARRKVDALIVQSTFTSIADMAKVAFPWLPIKIKPRNQFASIDKIGGIAVPKLFLHGDDDEVVPYEQGERLFEAAKEPKKWVKLEGAKHNDTLVERGPEYFGAVDDFLRAHGM